MSVRVVCQYSTLYINQYYQSMIRRCVCSVVPDAVTETPSQRVLGYNTILPPSCRSVVFFLQTLKPHVPHKFYNTLYSGGFYLALPITNCRVNNVDNNVDVRCSGIFGLFVFSLFACNIVLLEAILLKGNI